MNDNRFIPDGFHIVEDEVTKQSVLVWEKDTGERLEVTLDPGQLHLVLSEIQMQIEPGSGCPVNVG